MEFSGEGFFYLLAGYFWFKAANRCIDPPVILYSHLFLGILFYLLGIKKIFINTNELLIQYYQYFYDIAGGVLLFLLFVSLFFDFSKKNREKLKLANEIPFKESTLNTWDTWLVITIVISVFYLSFALNLIHIFKFQQ